MSPARVAGSVTSYRTYPEPPIAAGVPELYDMPPRVLLYWRDQGWLPFGNGTGTRYPWKDPQIAAQIRWLKRLQDCGRRLDDEDAIGGFRLRNQHADIGIRIGTRPWTPFVGIDLATISDAYTIAEVNR